MVLLNKWLLEPSYIQQQDRSFVQHQGNVLVVPSLSLIPMLSCSHSRSIRKFRYLPASVFLKQMMQCLETVRRASSQNSILISWSIIRVFRRRNKYIVRKQHRPKRRRLSYCGEWCEEHSLEVILCPDVPWDLIYLPILCTPGTLFVKVATVFR